MDSDTLYRKLQQHLDRMPVGYPATESGVEIRILKRLFTPEDAALALELSAVPEAASTIHKRVPAMTPEGLRVALEDMHGRGLILRVETPDGPRYGKLMYVIGFFERQVERLTPELEHDSRQYMEEAFSKAFHTGKTTQLRTVPINKTIPVERNVATYHDIRAYVENSPGPFAAMTCICRKGKDISGESCRQTRLRENCLMLGMAATSMTQLGTAHAITREEMLERLDAADREGLVLQPENTQNPLFVCCCCGCCCGILTSAKRLERPADFFTADFYATLNAEWCEQCGVCEGRCQMDAIVVEGDLRRVEMTRCIGCGLCVTTCPSGALRMEKKEGVKAPPADTRALYLKMLQDRFGALEMAKIAAKAALGQKI